MTSLPSDLPDGLTSDQLRQHINQLFEQMSRATGHSNELSATQSKELIAQLPRLTEDQVTALGHKDSVCPICFVSLLGIVAEEELASAMDSPAHPIEELGVTRLAQTWQCGHIFCRRDISRWINERHSSCPMCRRPFRQDASPSEIDETIEDPELGFVMSLDADNLLEIIGRNGGLFMEGPTRRHADTDRGEYSGMYS